MEKNNKKIINKKDKTKKIINKKIYIILLIISFILFFSIIFSILNIVNSKILPRIKIMNIDIGNQDKQIVENNLEDIINKKINSDIILKYNDFETIINPKQFEANISIDEAVNEAYNIGRKGNIVTNNYAILWNYIFPKKIDGEIYIDEKMLEKTLEDVNNKLPGVMIDNSYYIEDDNLVIGKGKEGILIQKEELKEKIINELKNIENNSNIVIRIPVEKKSPEKINIIKIKEEIYKEPKDAYITKDPLEVHTHINGVDLGISIEEAEEMLKEEKEEYIIPLKITIPNKTTMDLGEDAFPNELSRYSTIFDMSNKNRNININLATNKIDGTIIMPGEIFSYNKIVGQRTIAEGYREAAAYSGGKVVQDVGGGVCQVSSTLYNAALLANLEIVKRSNHSFKTSYVPEGRDATVSWGAVDFQFKNSRKYPIKIDAKANNGVLNIKIFGIKEEIEYEVKIQTKINEHIPSNVVYKENKDLEKGLEIVEKKGVSGCKSETYRILRDKSGKIVSQTLLSKDVYNPMDRIIIRGTNKAKANLPEDEIIKKENNEDIVIENPNKY